MIVSVSRRTDIPSNPKNFLSQVEEGKLLAPGNRFQPARTISMSDVDAFVFWTKNIGPLLPHLANMPVPSYVMHTITGYGKELETNLPSLDERIASFVSAANILGPENMVWRFDPIIFFEGDGYASTLARFDTLARQLAGHTFSCTISFLQREAYPHINKRMERFGKSLIFPSEGISDMPLFPSEKGISTFCHELVSIAKTYSMEVNACADEKDLSRFDIGKAHCIDPKIINRLVPGFVSVKDTGQRKTCGCIKSVDIGAYRTCKNGCVYCYACG